MAPLLPSHNRLSATVNLTAVRNNVASLVHQVHPADVMCVVKADGYGHGAVPVANASIEGGATWLGVAVVEEGIELRDAGITVPILVLSEPPTAVIPQLLDAGLTPTVYTERFVAALRDEAVSRALSSPVDVHVKIDTGMNRVGVPLEQWPTFTELLADLPQIHVSGMFSHLATADKPENIATKRQVEAFTDAIDIAKKAGLRPTILHLANSAATTLIPEAHFQIVRTGIICYGLEPAPGVLPEGVAPALSLQSQLTFIKTVEAGASVSYGHRWTATQRTTIGTVAGGYADGIRRGLSNTGHVVINGRRAPIIGAVCMDQFLVDLGPDAADAVDDTVWLIGGPDDDAVTVAEWATWLDTITYEVTCGLGTRIPRRYVTDEPV